MTEPSANFLSEKNKSVNTPIMLYELEIPGGTGNLYLAEWDTDIVYPTSGGNTYIRFPITHEGISVNSLGEIDSVRVKISSIDRSIVSILEANNGLIGYKVIMKLVFLSYLDDEFANISFTYYIDSVETTEQSCVFNLTSKLDLYEVKIPARIFERDHCQWHYKGEGCWVASGGVWVAPDGFINEGVDCDHTRIGTFGCKYHGNSKRFGGFPAIPMRGVIVI